MSSPESVPAVLRCNEFEIDLLTRELRQRGAPVETERKTLDVLMHLASNRDRVVSRTELHELLWPERVMSENSLNHWIRRARTAIGDTDRRSQIIRTVYGEGLRFVPSQAPVAGSAGSDGGQPARPESPLIERERECQVGERLFDLLERGQGSMVLVSGEAGMGKTRLARAFESMAASRGVPVYVARAIAGISNSLWVFSSILEDLLMDLSSEARERIQGDDLLPVLSALDLEDRKMRGWPVHTAEETRFRLVQSITRILRDAAGPRLLVIEDLQWVDPPSMLVLDLLLRDLTGHPVIVVATYRDDEMAYRPEIRRILAGFASREGVAELKLAGLSAEGVAHLVRSSTLRELSPESTEKLRDRTRGNPFFVRQLALLGDEDTGPNGGLLPQSVALTIQRRVSRLTPPARHILEMYSLCPDGFSLRLLFQATGLPKVQIAAALDEAVQARIVEPTTTSGEYCFVHALMIDALANTLPPVRRAEKHLILAHALERMLEEDQQVSLESIAHHYRHALGVGAWRKAFEYSERCAWRAMGFLQYERAAEHFEAANEALTAGEGQRTETRAGVLLGRADALAAGGWVKESRSAYSEVLRMARECGLATTGARAALALAAPPYRLAIDELESALEMMGETQSPLRIELLSQLGECWAARADGIARGERYLIEAEGAARTIENDVALADALLARTRSLNLRSDPDLSRRIALADRAGELAGDDVLRQMEALRARISPLLEGGRFVEADASADRLAGLVGATRLVEWAWHLPFYSAGRAISQARLADGAAYLATAREQTGEIRDASTRLASFVLMGELPPTILLEFARGNLSAMSPMIEHLHATLERPQLLIVGGLVLTVGATRGPEEARALMEELIPGDVPDTGSGVVTALCWIALAAFSLGDERRMKQCRERLWPYKEMWSIVPEQTANFGPVAITLGVLAAGLGDWDEADELLTAATTRAEATDCTLWIAQAYCTHAIVLHIAGRSADEPRRERLCERAEALAREFGLTQILNDLERLRPS